MICKKCNSVIQDDSKFCSFCGEIVLQEENETSVLFFEDKQNNTKGADMRNNQEASLNDITKGETNTSTNIDVNPVFINPFFSSDGSENKCFNENDSFNARIVQQDNCKAQYQMNSTTTKLSMIECYKMFWTKYVNFDGRSRRLEYWYPTLINCIISCVLYLLTALIPSLAFVIQILRSLFGLASLIPGLAICVRRLHDIGKSGNNLWLWVIPIVGWIVLIVFFCKEGQAEQNAYGPNPKCTKGE